LVSLLREGTSKEERGKRKKARGKITSRKLII